MLLPRLNLMRPHLSPISPPDRSRLGHQSPDRPAVQGHPASVATSAENRPRTVPKSSFQRAGHLASLLRSSALRLSWKSLAQSSTARTPPLLSSSPRLVGPSTLLLPPCSPRRSPSLLPYLVLSGRPRLNLSPSSLSLSLWMDYAREEAVAAQRRCMRRRTSRPLLLCLVQFRPHPSWLVTVFRSRSLSSHLLPLRPPLFRPKSRRWPLLQLRLLLPRRSLRQNPRRCATAPPLSLSPPSLPLLPILRPLLNPPMLLLLPLHLLLLPAPHPPFGRIPPPPPDLHLSPPPPHPPPPPHSLRPLSHPLPSSPRRSPPPKPYPSHRRTSFLWTGLSTLLPLRTKRTLRGLQSGRRGDPKAGIGELPLPLPLVRLCLRRPHLPPVVVRRALRRRRQGFLQLDKSRTRS